MTEITRVPLQPIAKGALSKLWIGVAAAALAAAGLAYATLPGSIAIDTLKVGTGPSPTVNDVVLIKYKGTLPDGKVFDQQEQAAFPVEGVIPGFTQALQKMQRGGKYKVEIPAALAYGDKAAGDIPPNTDLTFEIELLDFKDRAEIEAAQRAMQAQMQQMQGGAPGGPQGMPQGMPEGMPQGMPGPGGQ
ncbi:FKBP-type peptidyl-prolyl cis-trans isomerase [Novosphingobium sp.]|uniref:FKBP-type peptidyl-prolyl cis-trans isomerase n=1 Tax=Novosphingobium sp. TaxID=1874826 RepID=UPI00273384D7|nr:FKBP-type peptidyl-prolyl cis-trans isomerase [Novosphingobium sp.]MDP3905805.1 FKBP-type peptidyl-prolyl cis-trans isomerase [Novosphingobium sp.]